jgi:hypothetical protein
MNSLHQQIADLSAKIDALKELTERLSDKISAEKVQKLSSELESHRSTALDAMVGHPSGHQQSVLETEITHKDILADVELIDTEGYSAEHQVFSSDVQVQRLTAQLTAAYNRIASLEEQLLSNRIQHEPSMVWDKVDRPSLNQDR